MYTYKLTRIVFNDDTAIEPGKLTVIVGPNNSGKSRALKDLIAKTTQEYPGSEIVVHKVEWTLPQNFQEFRGAYNFNPFQEDGRWMLKVLGTNLCQ